MTALRAFIALELDDALRAAFKQLERRLKQENRAAQVAVRWVAPQNIHLTLKFLGNIDPALVSPLTNALRKRVHGYGVLELTARGLGCFPNTRRPNNVWVGLEGDVERAALLAKRIEDACDQLGLPREERGFTPHLTLGRIQRDASNGDRAAVGEYISKFPRTEFGVIRASAIHLISSDLRQAGPVYSTLADISLSEPSPTAGSA